MTYSRNDPSLYMNATQRCGQDIMRPLYDPRAYSDVNQKLPTISDPGALVWRSSDNALVQKLGEIARDAGAPGREGVGDDIDRGLILLRLLAEHGFTVRHTPAESKRQERSQP